MSETRDIRDAAGRAYTVRKLSVLEEMRMLRAIGSAQSDNDRYVQIVLTAASVIAIDGVPAPKPTNERQIDAMIERIGDEGFVALLADRERNIREAIANAEAAMSAGETQPNPLPASAS